MKINFGPPIEGYENFDPSLKLEVEDGSVDEIRSVYTLQQFSYRDTESVLREWKRALKQGGVLKISVPDFQSLASKYLQGQPDMYDAWVYGAQNESNSNRSLFDKTKLVGMLKAIGFGYVTDWISTDQDLSSHPSSLNIKCVNAADPPKYEKPQFPQTLAIMSMPRLAFTENMFSVFTGTMPLGIHTLKHDGCFWGQGMENLMEEAIRLGAENVLTIDYDTVFCAQDVVTLHDLLNLYPEYDAITTVQCRRESVWTLFTMTDDKGNMKTQVDLNDLAKDIMPIHTGHFGLTLIRTASIQKMKKPWFMHHPDADGRWTEAKCDDDIHFWLEFKKAGLRAGIAPKVAVGHMQQTIFWPDQKLQPIVQFVSGYQKDGKPVNCLK